MTTNLQSLEAAARELAAREVVTETNAGTYSSNEACQAIGTGDSKYADYDVYTRVGDGAQRHVGCDRNKAPGYARHFRSEITKAQKELSELRRKISALRRTED